MIDEKVHVVLEVALDIGHTEDLFTLLYLLVLSFALLVFLLVSLLIILLIFLICIHMKSNYIYLSEYIVIKCFCLVAFHAHFYAVYIYDAYGIYVGLTLQYIFLVN